MRFEGPFGGKTWFEYVAHIFNLWCFEQPVCGSCLPQPEAPRTPTPLEGLELPAVLRECSLGPKIRFSSLTS